MKKNHMALTAIFAAGFFVSAQESTDLRITSTGEDIILVSGADPYEGIDSSVIKTEAQFPDGPQKCMLYINKAFRFDDDILEHAPINIKMIAKFIVEKDGRLTNIQITRDVKYDTGKQLIRILNAMPLWNPAQDKDCNPIRSQFVLPVSLYVTQE